ncbi:MAG: acyl-CoA dehydrogenase family protein [Deltaproteobacteria bacterium]|nr:acyl-CoA dehydrogenase family protein [Deltaproteobacteria bacterium]
MDMELTREQKMIVKNVKEFMRKEIGPVADEMDRDGRLPDGIWQTRGDLGLLGLGIPEEYGGSGMDKFTFTLVVEQMARVCPGLALSLTAHSNLCAHNIEHNATEVQKHKYLPGLCSGDRIGCLALTEPDAGSDAVGIQTTATRDGDHFVLNGSKTFITNGPIADIALVYTKTDLGKKARGITAFIVEKGTPGFSVSPKMEKMGHRCSPTSELIFNDCRVPAENVLGQVDNGVHVMMTGLDSERVVCAGLTLGNAEAALELGLKYAKSRRQFDQPICNFQMIKAKLANMYAEIEAARGLVYRAARLADQADRGGKGTEIHKLAAAAILFAAKTTRRAVDESLQIHGGYGYTLDYPINRFYRDAKLMEIGAGTMEIRQLVVADELIKRGPGYI